MGDRARRQVAASSASVAPTTPAPSRRRDWSSSASSSPARSSREGTASSSPSSSPRVSGRCAPTEASRRSCGRRRSRKRWFHDCAQLHVSGYALLREPIRFAAACAIEHARAAGAHVSVDLSSWSAIRDFGAERFRDAARRRCARRRLRERGRGADRRRTRFQGAAGSSSEAPTVPRSRATSAPRLPVEAVVDSTGAGDAFAAGWLVGGPDLALAAAARCVQQAGSMP